MPGDTHSLCRSHGSRGSPPIIISEDNIIVAPERVMFRINMSVSFFKVSHQHIIVFLTNLFPFQNRLATETAPAGIFNHFLRPAALFYRPRLVLAFLFRKADLTHSLVGSRVALTAVCTYSESA